jgi:hypothetical protein
MLGICDRISASMVRCGVARGFLIDLLRSSSPIEKADAWLKSSVALWCCGWSLRNFSIVSLQI